MLRYLSDEEKRLKGKQFGIDTHTYTALTQIVN